MLQNLHTHTVFCDGKSSPEEMIESAIALGFESLGFSSHAPTSICDDCELRDFPGYVKKINELKTIYKSKIKIFLGIEFDFYSAGQVSLENMDYIIGSVHYSNVGGKTIFYDFSAERTKKHIEEDFGGDGIAYARSYYERLMLLPSVIRADFIGHFDIVSKFSDIHPEFFDTDSYEYKKIALDALHTVREKNEFFEVNTGALSRGLKNMPYPAPFILDEMKKLGCKLIITSDCHRKEHLDFYFNETKEYIRSHGFDTVYYLTGNGFVGEKI